MNEPNEIPDTIAALAKAFKTEPSELMQAYSAGWKKSENDRKESKMKRTDDDWDFYQGDQIWETRQVMLAQGRRLDALEGLVKFQHQQIKDLLDWVVDNAKLDVKEKEVIADGMTVTADMLDDLKAQIEGLTKRYENHDHFKSDNKNFTSGPVLGVTLDDGSE